MAGEVARYGKRALVGLLLTAHDGEHAIRARLVAQGTGGKRVVERRFVGVLGMQTWAGSGHWERGEGHGRHFAFFN